MTSNPRCPLQANQVPPRPKGYTTYPEIFAGRVSGKQRHALGDFFGLQNFGVNLTILEPGAETALRHRHEVQDEFLFVLRGNPTLITDQGERELEPGMCMGFPAGGEDAHHLINRGQDRVELLQIGDRLPGDSASYPDDDLQGHQDDQGQWQFLHKDGRPYSA